MDPLEIQFELKKRGITQKAIAEALGISPMAVSLVINKKIISNRAMKAVAKLIHRDHADVFPEYYRREKVRISLN